MPRATLAAGRPCPVLWGCGPICLLPTSSALHSGMGPMNRWWKPECQCISSLARAMNIYGSEPSREAYNRLYDLYTAAGLTREEISQLLVLDIKDADYFREGGAPNQYGGGNLFAQDPEIMGWLFSQG